MEREISSPGRKLTAVLKKNAMLVILVLVYIFFMVTTGGNINVDLYRIALDECQTQYGEENPHFYERLQAQYARNNQ